MGLDPQVFNSEVRRRALEWRQAQEEDFRAKLSVTIKERVQAETQAYLTRMGILDTKNPVLKNLKVGYFWAVQLACICACLFTCSVNNLHDCCCCCVCTRTVVPYEQIVSFVTNTAQNTCHCMLERMQSPSMTVVISKNGNICADVRPLYVNACGSDIILANCVAGSNALHEPVFHTCVMNCCYNLCVISQQHRSRFNGHTAVTVVHAFNHKQV